MYDNSWPGQQYGASYPTTNYPPTANLPHSAHHSGHVPRADAPLYGGTAYYSGHGPIEPAPARPSPHWPLVVVAVVLSGVLLGGVAVYHAVQVGRRWAAGDVRGATRASGLAKTWAFAGIAVGAILTAAAVAFVSVAGPSALGSISPASSQVPLQGAPPLATPPGVIDPTLDKPADLDAGESVFFDEMQSGLQLAVERLNRGEDPTSQCIAVLVTAEGFSDGFAGAAGKAREQCGREIPIAWAGHQLDSAAAAADPFDTIMECATAKVALYRVEERFADPRVGELRTRSEQVCG